MHARLFSLLLLPCAFALATAPLPAAAGQSAADASYERIQLARRQARAMASEHATPAALQDAARQLEQELAYLDTPAVREQADGDKPLYFRGHDVRLDLAVIYARLDMREQALAMLEQMQHYAWTPMIDQALAADGAFAALRHEPRFKLILQRSVLASRLWKGPASDTPYREKLTVEERIAGLSLFWAEARANFVHFDHVPELDWNQVYLDYLPKVMAADKTADYYRVLMQLAPLLQDGHSNIYPPEALNSTFFARPPLNAVLIDNRVVIEKVHSPSLAQRVRVGDEVLSIDGMPVRRYAQEKIAPFVSSSTPQDKAVRLYAYQLFAGDARESLTLGLRDSAGVEREEVVAREGYDDIVASKPFEVRTLLDGMVYFALDHFASDASVRAFEQVLPQVMQAKALIIDVRNNGGGSTEFGNRILKHLTQQPIPGARSIFRSDEPYLRAQGNSAILWRRGEQSQGMPRKPGTVFTGKVAVLTGPKTFSAGEDFVLAFHALKRGVTVGETTAGSSGQPLGFDLPGGGSARICVKRDMLPDGTDFVGIGISPLVHASASLEALRAGKDLVLERAMAELRQAPAR